MLNNIWKKYWNILNDKIKVSGGDGILCAFTAQFMRIIDDLFDGGKRKTENVFVVDNNVNFDGIVAAGTQNGEVCGELHCTFVNVLIWDKFGCACCINERNVRIWLVLLKFDEMV